jgi:hypothetical protein
MVDLGRNDRFRREADTETPDLKTVIVIGQYTDPSVVGFKAPSEDVSTYVAQELRRRCDLQQRGPPFFLQDLVDR